VVADDEWSQSERNTQMDRVWAVQQQRRFHLHDLRDLLAEIRAERQERASMPMEARHWWQARPRWWWSACVGLVILSPMCTIGTASVGSVPGVVFWLIGAGWLLERQRDKDACATT
jgi:hypothetical protein